MPTRRTKNRRRSKVATDPTAPSVFYTSPLLPSTKRPRAWSLQSLRPFWDCRGLLCCPRPSPIDPSIPARLNRLQDHFNFEARITSGFRCQAYNATIQGSSSTSLHTIGRALDIAYPVGLDPLELQRFAYLSCGFTGVICNMAKLYVHLDTRPGAPYLPEPIEG